MWQTNRSNSMPAYELFPSLPRPITFVDDATSYFWRASVDQDSGVSLQVSKGDLIANFGFDRQTFADNLPLSYVSNIRRSLGKPERLGIVYKLHPTLRVDK